MALKLKNNATLTKIKTRSFFMTFTLKLRWTPHTPLSMFVYMSPYMCHHTHIHRNTCNITYM